MKGIYQLLQQIAGQAVVLRMKKSYVRYAALSNISAHVALPGCLFHDTP
jgi:hypothetical protein